MSRERLTDLLNLSFVPRWSIVPMVRDQSVADHSFRVAVIAMELAKRSGVHVSWADLWYCLIHDAYEAKTGDIPGNFKRSLPVEARAGIADTENATMPWFGAEIKGMFPSLPTGMFITSIIKIADLIEALTWVRMNGRTHSYCDEYIHSIQARILQQLYDTVKNSSVLESHAMSIVGEIQAGPVVIGT